MEDKHAHARMLLANSDISVPSSFFGDSLNDLKNVMQSDPRLAESYRNASGPRPRITQFLAGAPAQMARYRNAPEAAKAVLDAAIDLRRFGHSPSIPINLLADMAAITMDFDVFNRLKEGWFEGSLGYLLPSCKGASGPLIQVRRQPASGGRGNPPFQLSDYLEQVGREARQSFFPPPSFMVVALKNITKVEDLRAIGNFLVHAGRVFSGAQLYWRALELGDWESGDELSDLLDYAGDHSGAVKISEIRCQGGDPRGSESLAFYLHRNGQEEEAVRVCLEEFDLGNPGPLFKVRDSYEMGEDLAGYGRLESLILSPRFPDMFLRKFGPGDYSDNSDRFAGDLAERLGLSKVEAEKLIADEMKEIVPRMNFFTEALNRHIVEIEAATARVKGALEEYMAEKGLHGETKALRRRIEACQEAGQSETAWDLITQGMNAGIIGVEVLANHLEEFNQLDSAEAVERLGVDWNFNPVPPWGLGDVRRSCCDILNSADFS
ncbi:MULTISPECIES: hypothetical protein [unclassified Streptomyces]|uniref:hypothetical protein n=1 Tax=unclassified Streptomyces TaxID=2593676 RepID=UPI0036625946